MKISDEQYMEIGRALGWSPQYAVEHGMKAIAACAPILLAEPTKEEIAEALPGPITTYAASLFANRLRAVTEPEDKAVEAATQVMESMNWVFKKSHVVKIVAAVRNADRSAK